jgi:predicted flavoprotein YhiN
MSALQTTRHVAVIGGGTSGLKAAATKSQRGLRAEFIDAMSST